MLEELVKLRQTLEKSDNRDSTFTLQSIRKVTGYGMQSLQTFESNPEAYLHNKTFVRLYAAAVGAKITYSISEF